MIATVLFATATALAQAQAPVYTPAPVPNRGPSLGDPADRAGRPTGADNAAPFSGLPTGTGDSNGQATPDALGNPARQDSPVPNLSR